MCSRCIPTITVARMITEPHATGRCCGPFCMGSKRPSHMLSCAGFAQILLQFLLDYPVGEKRLDSHLQFLLANLAYEHETGRLAVCPVQALPLGLVERGTIKRTYKARDDTGTKH